MLTQYLKYAYKWFKFKVSPHRWVYHTRFCRECSKCGKCEAEYECLITGNSSWETINDAKHPYLCKPPVKPRRTSTQKQLNLKL